MILEEEPVSISQKIYRIFAGLFIAVLVTMLIFTLIPGDAEQNLLRMIIGQDQMTAGKVGDETIPIDYFKAARLECYYMYKQRFPTAADDASMLENCAFNQIKSLKIDKVLANAAGYHVSDLSIKEDISNEARKIHSQSGTSAGYSSDEVRSVDDIYRSILQSVPMHYRQDTAASIELYERFLYTDVKESEEEQKIRSELENVRLSLSYISFSDEELSKVIGEIPQITDAEIQKEYDASVANKTVPMGEDGKPQPLEVRKALIFNKLQSEAKEKKLSELKGKILSAKGAENANLGALALIAGVKIADLNKVSLSSIGPQAKENKTELPKFLSGSAFLKDITNQAFGKGKVGGPYTDKEKTFYVEFKDLSIESGNSVGKNVAMNESNSNRTRMFLYEIKQSLGGIFPIQRNKSVE
ncbi:MAG TPA: hypothetical protein PK079_08770 [Leptospiraceae bacterium]|nr:hypothetical protein [Leptospiraceae bacterium]HMW04259.1 hypothetical protein [Leptospiraceae bacterium]HMX30605.1 hypothetical protein [Leptospiraceae bacterium]HMY31305.1 hypothetical protein [Leptospiraceae bacterium]HMZ63418.1 hypothetical protein [Leptospiraceae bacterium]